MHIAGKKNIEDVDKMLDQYEQSWFFFYRRCDKQTGNKTTIARNHNCRQMETEVETEGIGYSLNANGLCGNNQYYVQCRVIVREGERGGEKEREQRKP